jgi:hypothetical protein
MIMCAVRRYDFLLRTLPHNSCHPYIATEDSVVWHDVFHIFRVPPEVETHDQIDSATRQFPLPTEFGGLNVPSLALDVGPTHHA